MLQFPPLTPAVRALLVVLAVSYVLQTIVEGAVGVPVTLLFALTPDLHLGLLWQWASYVLVELPGAGSALRRALDLLFIYWMLSPHEERFGPRRALTLALLGVVAAAALVLVAGLLAPGFVSGAIGASPIVWAAFGAFAQIAGKQPVRFFMLPPTSAWLLLGVFLALPLLDTFWSHDAAHFLMAIGGSGAGILWARRIMAPRRPVKAPPKRTVPAGRFRVIEGGGEGDPDEKPRWLN